MNQSDKRKLVSDLAEARQHLKEIQGLTPERCSVVFQCGGKTVQARRQFLPLEEVIYLRLYEQAVSRYVVNLEALTSG